MNTQGAAVHSLSTIRNGNSSSGISADAIISIFERSAVPAKVMFFCNDQWMDFPSDATEVLKNAFGSGTPTVGVDINGSSRLIDFQRMREFDLTNGTEQSIAWIDVDGKSFFPKTFENEVKFEGESKVSGPSQGQLESKAAYEGASVVENVLIGCTEISNSGDQASSKEDKNDCDRNENIAGKRRQGKGIVVYLPDLNEPIQMEDEYVEGNLGISEMRNVESPCLKENRVAEANFGNLEVDKVRGKILKNTNSGGHRLLGKKNLDGNLNSSKENHRVDVPKVERVHFNNSSEYKKFGLDLTLSLGKPSFDLKGMNLLKVREGHGAYITIKNVFLKGMGNISSNTRVESIYWCSHASPMGSARLQVFQRTVEMIKANRGDANVRYAWYGASSKVIESIILHGFMPAEIRSSVRAYGTGIYLTAERYSLASISHLEPDDDGEFHVMLCRLIMGNMEQIKLGSCQFQPSNEEYDSGVDNLVDPRLYVVWSTRMNTCLLPEYIVNFKYSKQLEESWRRQLIQDLYAIPVSLGGSTKILQPSPSSSCQVLPASHHRPSICAQGQNKERLPRQTMIPKMTFSALFCALRRYLPQPSIERLNNVYNDYKVGNIGKGVLVETIRLIAGDTLIITAFCSIRYKAGSNHAGI